MLCGLGQASLLVLCGVKKKVCNTTGPSIQKKNGKSSTLTHSIRIIFAKALLVGHMLQALQRKKLMDFSKCFQ